MINNNGLTLNNFLSFLIELSFSILFLIIFSSIHFTLLNKTKLQSKLDKSKKWNFWYFFGFGFFISILTFIVSQATAFAIGSNIGLPVTILGLIFALTFYYNRSVQLGSIVPTIIWVLYNFEGFTGTFSWEWMARLIAVVYMSAISIASTFFKTKKWPTYLISLVIVALGFLTIILCTNDNEQWFHVVELTLAILSSVLYYAIIRWLNRVLNTMNYMAKANLYTDNSYVIPSQLNNQFKQLIKENNIDQALIVLFDIKSNKTKTLEQIANIFKNKKTLLFKSRYDTYGVILYDNKYHITDINECYEGNDQPNRSTSDPLSDLEQQLKDLNVYAFISVYGIHSNDLDELIKFNQYAMKQFDIAIESNKIQFFNSNMFNNRDIDEISYVQLTQKVNLNEFVVTLELIEFNKDNKQYVYPRIYWPKLFTCDLNIIMKQFDENTSNALLRNLDIKAIEMYSVSDYKGIKPLLISYPIAELTNPFFATNQFIKKLSLYGVDKKDIILSFDCKKIRLWPRSILNNLKELENYGIKYMFIDVINTYALTILKPIYVLFDKTIESNKIKLDKAIELSKQYNQNILFSDNK